MIEIIPATDIIGGKCVRLTKGDYDKCTTYEGSPADMAVEFERMGAHRLHVVDLDGAKSKHVVNTQSLREITRRTSLTVDFGGGIKSERDIEEAFEAGASMVTVGSIAATDKELFLRWLDKYGSDRIILGADVRNGKISVNGWKEDSSQELMPFLEDYFKRGVRNVLCTDISKDGTLKGPSVELYKEIMKAFPQLNLIASGGISSIRDIEMLDQNGIPSVVFGKAYYEGKITNNELIEAFNRYE